MVWLIPHETAHSQVFLPAPRPTDAGRVKPPPDEFPGASPPGARLPRGTSTQDIDMTTQTGTVRWFSAERGFGFIAPDEGGKDLFAQFRDIQTRDIQTLVENQRVRFDLAPGPMGLQASNIRSVG